MRSREGHQEARDLDMKKLNWQRIKNMILLDFKMIRNIMQKKSRRTIRE